MKSLSLAVLGVACAAMVGIGTARTPDLPSCDSWRPAYGGNYTNSSRPSSYPIKYVVIHKVQGSAAGAASWFQNPSANVSAHFTYDKDSGYCYQSVREADIAWHAGNWTYNTQSVGIEHGGYAGNNDTSNACYKQSAKETKSCIIYYNVQHNRNRVIGHNQVPGSTHWDPGPHWRWGYYMDLCDPTPPEPHYTAPAVVSHKDTKLHLYAKGKNGSIYGRNWTQGVGWSRHGTREFLYGAAAVTRKAGHLAIYATGKDREIWHKTWHSDSGWGNWRKVPGGPNFHSQPAVVSKNQNHVEVFAKAAGDRIWHAWWTAGNGWSTWRKLDNRQWKDAPAVISKGSQHMELFARAPGNKIWRKAWYQGSGWGSWHKMGDRTFSKRPGAVSKRSDRMEVFSLESGNRVWHNYWQQGNGWSGWRKLDPGNDLKRYSPVGAVSRIGDHVEIFARRHDGTITGKIWRGGTSWQNWHPHGPRP